MERTRIQLADGVYLTYLPARKFKTSLLSAQFVTPLQQETASAYALLPAILRRGTVRYPDLGALSARLDRLYGASVDYTAVSYTHLDVYKRQVLCPAHRPEGFRRYCRLNRSSGGPLPPDPKGGGQASSFFDHFAAAVRAAAPPLRPARSTAYLYYTASVR